MLAALAQSNCFPTEILINGLHTAAHICQSVAGRHTPPPPPHHRDTIVYRGRHLGPSLVSFIDY